MAYWAFDFKQGKRDSLRGFAPITPRCWIMIPRIIIPGCAVAAVRVPLKYAKKDALSASFSLNRGRGTRTPVNGFGDRHTTTVWFPCISGNCISFRIRFQKDLVTYITSVYFCQTLPLFPFETKTLIQWGRFTIRIIRRDQSPSSSINYYSIRDFFLEISIF